MAGRLALAAFAAFFAVAAWSAWTATPCGCFGTVMIHPALLAVFDAVAMTALAVEWAKLSVKYRLIASSALWLAVGGLVFDASIRNWRDAVDTRPTILVQPKDDLGGPLRWLPLVAGSESLSKGEWLVSITRTGCPSCRSLLEECAVRPKDRRVKLAVILLPSEDGANDEPDLAALVLRAPASRRWTGALPAAVRLSDGVVTGVSASLAVFDGEGR